MDRLWDAAVMTGAAPGVRWARVVAGAAIPLALAEVSCAGRATARVLAGSPTELATPQAAGRRISIDVTEAGYQPNKIKVAKNEDVTLVFTRKTTERRSRRVLVYFDNNHFEKKIERELPLDQPVEITVRFAVHGEHGFACCPCGHLGGIIQVE